MMTAEIFDIERNSYVDGPGLRTTVFFKGCNLNCRWCHNPESKSRGKVFLYYQDKCTHCGLCARHCPEKAVDKTGFRDPAKCTFCGKCEKYCPQRARKVCGRQASLEELLNVIEKDADYYEATGGGVTCSGGECMLQLDFLEEFLKALKEKGYDTAVDTAGNLPFASFERVLPYADHFLYDVKCITSSLHTWGTGVDNARILENLKRLLALCPEKVIVRVPVIPGFNAEDEEIGRIADFFRENGRPQLLEALPYHALGENKARAMGKEPMVSRAPSKEDMARYQKILKG